MKLPADVEGMVLFVKIVEHRSFSAAGRALDLPKATLSRRLAQLEARLGTRLLLRNSRGLSLTDAGRAYHERCRPIVADMEAAEYEVRARGGEPCGLIRLTATAGFGQAVLVPKLLAFARPYPAVRFDVELTDRRVNVVEEGFDLAVRMGPLEDTELLSRRLARVERRLVAHPAYLEAAGAPRRPADLKRLDCLVGAPDLQHWTLEGAGGEEAVAVRWRMALRHVFALRDAVCAGFGVAVLPAFLADEHLAAGRLVRVLPGWTPRAAEATALLARSRTPSPAVDRLVEFLAADFRKDEARAAAVAR